MAKESVKPEPFIFDPDAELPVENTLYEGILAEGDLTVWVGREKHRKSNLLLQWAVCGSIGRTFLNFRFAASKPLHVVYIDFESKTRSLKQRYAAISNAMALTEEEKRTLKKNLRIIEVRKTHSQGLRFPRFPARVKTNRERDDLVWWQKFAETCAADVYIVDPLRCMHAQDENDSLMEELLSGFRKVFRGATVIAAHHMTKRKLREIVMLTQDMRLWSDCARGSGAIKAHADVIVCQERIMDKDREVVYWGAFGKDIADVEPVRLEESDELSFFWQSSLDVPAHLFLAIETLKKAGGRFASKGEVAGALKEGRIPKSTAYRHVDALIYCGLLVEHERQWVVRAP